MKCSGLNCPMQYPYDVENCRCVDTCPYATKIPYTTADKLRAMSDEELAKTICTVDFCGFCDYERDNGTCHYIETHPDGILFDGCVQAAMRYLQAPAKEDT